jgi:uncharacterized protein
MRIEVENLTSAGEPFSNVYAPEELTLEEERVSLTGEVRVEGRASRKGEEVRLKGKIAANSEVVCDRCVKPIPLPLEVEFDTAFIPEAAEVGKTENVELLAEELGISSYDGDAVDLDDLVREQLLLAVPTRLVCREDCRGLCVNCGADLNEGECGCSQPTGDPRWAALANWKKTDES